MEANIKPIIDELNFIKKELSDIKRSMPDKEMFLTSEESVLLKESFDNEKKGKITSADDLLEELR